MRQLILDLTKPHEAIENVQWLAEPETPGVNYYRQNGDLYCWSESNCQYEWAWFWYDTNEMALRLQEERPLPKYVVP